MQDLKYKMLDIAEDGNVTGDELARLGEIIEQMDELSKTISELKNLGEKVMRRARGDG